MRFIFLGLLTLSFMGHQLAARLQRRAPEKPGDGHDDSEFVNAVDCISVWRPPFESTTGDVSPSDRWFCDDTACLLNSCTGNARGGSCSIPGALVPNSDGIVSEVSCYDYRLEKQSGEYICYTSEARSSMKACEELLEAKSCSQCL